MAKAKGTDGVSPEVKKAVEGLGIMLCDMTQVAMLLCAAMEGQGQLDSAKVNKCLRDTLSEAHETIALEWLDAAESGRDCVDTLSTQASHYGVQAWMMYKARNGGGNA